MDSDSSWIRIRCCIYPTPRVVWIPQLGLGPIIDQIFPTLTEVINPRSKNTTFAGLPVLSIIMFVLVVMGSRILSSFTWFPNSIAMLGSMIQLLLVLNIKEPPVMPLYPKRSPNSPNGYDNPIWAPRATTLMVESSILFWPVELCPKKVTSTKRIIALFTLRKYKGKWRVSDNISIYSRSLRIR